MKKVILSLFVAVSTFVSAQTLTNDAFHSRLGFEVPHLMVSNISGHFSDFKSTVTFTKEDLSDAKFTLTAKVATINTGVEPRDNHLRSADFFDAEKYPEMKFVSTSVTKEFGNKYKMEGDLTMHGVTKKVKFLAIGAAKTVKDPYGNIKNGFKVSGMINRKDFGLTWNAALEAGGVAVSEEVQIQLNIELNKA